MRDSEVFEGKTLKDIFKHIYENQTEKKHEIQELVTVMAKMIRQPDDVVTIGPVIQQFIDTSVKNDEQLVKMANIIQRYVAVESRVADLSDSNMLTEAERDTLLKNALADISETVTSIEDEVDNAKSKI